MFAKCKQVVYQMFQNLLRIFMIRLVKLTAYYFQGGLTE